MKKLLKLIIFVVIIVLCITNKDKITRFVVEKFIFSKDQNISTKNEYTLDYDFKTVKTTDDFFAKDKSHLIDILYTALNNGSDHFYFFCDYLECEEDVTNLIDKSSISYLNNFIHPFNTYKTLNITIDYLNKVTIDVDKTYSNNHIELVNLKIDEIINNKIKSNMTDKEKIKVFHDYIIDITKYDSEYINNNLNDLNSTSHNAIGPLFYNKALCGGYTDVMSIFLNKLKIPNYRISSENHIWNFVKLDNTWYHLDLTWDDPVTDNNTNLKLDTFFLIKTNKLESLNTLYHEFDKTIYIEAN